MAADRWSPIWMLVLTSSSILNSQASHQLVVGNAQRKHACICGWDILSRAHIQNRARLCRQISRREYWISAGPSAATARSVASCRHSSPGFSKAALALAASTMAQVAMGEGRHPDRVTARNLSLFGSSCQLVAKMALCRYQCFAHWLMLVLCLHSFLINDALSPMPAKLEQCTHLCKQFIQSTAYLFFHRCQRFSLSATQSASNSFH